jgi:hypothetical protein
MLPAPAVVGGPRHAGPSLHAASATTSSQAGAAQAPAEGHAESGVRSPYSDHPSLQHLQLLSTCRVNQTLVTTGVLCLDNEAHVPHILAHLGLGQADSAAVEQLEASETAATLTLADDIDFRILQVVSLGPGQPDSVSVLAPSSPNPALPATSTRVRWCVKTGVGRISNGLK